METEQYDDFDALVDDYGQDQIVTGTGETLDAAQDDAYDQLPTNTDAVGEYAAESADGAFFFFAGYTLEEASGGGSAAGELRDDILEPR